MPVWKSKMPWPDIAGACRRAAGALLILLASACGQERVMNSENAGTGVAWIDHPMVLAVTFHPRPEPPGPTTGFDVLDIPVAGHVTIGGRFYAARKDAPTILFFHGNGEIVADYHDIAALYRARGLNFLPVDYRGYGRSTGTPTIRAMLQDARRIYAHAREWLTERGYDGRLIVMGRSLGSASALELAAAYGDAIDGLIIDSGFAHTVPLLRRLGAPIPEHIEAPLIGQLDKLRAYAGPVLIIHGARDTIIPISDAEDLVNAAAHPDTTLLRVPDAGHNDILLVAGREYLAAIAGFAQGL